MLVNSPQFFAKLTVDNISINEKLLSLLADSDWSVNLEPPVPYAIRGDTVALLEDDTVISIFGNALVHDDIVLVSTGDYKDQALDLIKEHKFTSTVDPDTGIEFWDLPDIGLGFSFQECKVLLLGIYRSNEQ